MVYYDISHARRFSIRLFRCNGLASLWPWIQSRRAACRTLSCIVDEWSNWLFALLLLANTALGNPELHAAPSDVIQIPTTSTPSYILETHDDVVKSVALSIDGSQVASAGTDGMIEIWDVATAKVLRTLRGHEGNVYCLDISPNGKLIASGGRNLLKAGWPGEIKIWDIAGGKELITLNRHSDFVLSLAFSPDSRRLATGGNDNTVKLWDVDTGKELWSSVGNTGLSVNCVAFSPDGKFLIVAGWDSTVTICEAETGRRITQLENCPPAQSIAFSSDGKLLASAHETGPRLWEVGSWKEIPLVGTREAYPKGVTDVIFLPNENALITSSSDLVIRIWDLQQRKVVWSVQQPEPRKSHTGKGGWLHIVLSRNGRCLASIDGWSAKVQIWDLRPRKD